uniref:Uncharacterized protein n=1 Tax=Oryza brachyantha TaxID=4533 RepID=J3N8G4_ORYBR
MANTPAVARNAATGWSHGGARVWPRAAERSRGRGKVAVRASSGKESWPRRASRIVERVAARADHGGSVSTHTSWSSSPEAASDLAANHERVVAPADRGEGRRLGHHPALPYPGYPCCTSIRN